ncbi:MAG: hypothetical protein VB024_10685 [Dysgonamonadaceae bacterium]|nr:hypothetical protein [Dysgonamonadaceae bacterium]
MTHEQNEYRKSVTINSNILTDRLMTVGEYYRVLNLLSAAETLTELCRIEDMPIELQDKLGEVMATIESAKELMDSKHEMTTELLSNIEDYIIKN